MAEKIAWHTNVINQDCMYVKGEVYYWLATSSFFKSAYIRAEVMATCKNEHNLYKCCFIKTFAKERASLSLVQPVLLNVSL